MRKTTNAFVLVASLSLGCSSSPDTSAADADASTAQVADGSPGSSDAAVDLFPDGLSCTTISLCTSYEADPRRVPFPSETGGVLRDGLYRAVQGTSIPYGLAIYQGKYSLIFENLSVAHGDIAVNGDTLIMTSHTYCSPSTLNDDPTFTMTQESFFAVDGDTLLTYSGCDSADPNQCASPTRLERVNSLCDDLSSLYCESGDCSCATFTDGTIPPKPPGGGCEF